METCPHLAAGVFSSFRVSLWLLGKVGRHPRRRGPWAPATRWCPAKKKHSGNKTLPRVVPGASPTGRNLPEPWGDCVFI